MRPGAPRARHRAAGFVITLEFLLVMAIFVIPVMVGLILLGRKLYTLYLDQRDFVEQPYSRAVVWDYRAEIGFPPRVVGPVVGYDQFEAPLVIFRDLGTNGGVTLGVRTDRFTSYGEVFYANATCDPAGGAWVREWDHDDAITGGSGTVYPPAGFAYQDQSVSYAVGRSPAGVNGRPGVLYRSTSIGGSAPPGIGSVWISQYLGAGGNPCQTPSDLGDVNDLVAATAVIDFSQSYTSDGAGHYFRLAFPTPSTMPALGDYFCSEGGVVTPCPGS